MQQKKFSRHFGGFKPVTPLKSGPAAKRIQNRVPWTEVHSLALAQLKEALINATNTRLSVPDFNRTFNVHVDTSDSSIADYLGQVTNDDVECPLAFLVSN